MASGDGDAPQAGREANLHPRCPAAPASAAAGGGAAPSQDPTRIRSRYGGPRGSSEGACRRGAAGRIRHWREGPPSTNPATDPLCGVIDCPPLVLALAQPRSRNPGRIAPPRARRRKTRSESGPGRRMKNEVGGTTAILLDYCCYYYRPSSFRFYLFYVNEVRV
jgi:hypothetical protein